MRPYSRRYWKPARSTGSSRSAAAPTSRTRWSRGGCPGRCLRSTPGRARAGFRKWLPADDIDAKVSLGGSFYSENVADYYFSPYDVGYGRIVKFDHDFIGRKALEAQVAAGTTEARRKVTLQWNARTPRKSGGQWSSQASGRSSSTLPIAHYATYHYDRVESKDGALRGRSLHTGYSSNYRSVLSLAVVDASVAEPGTEVVVVWGEPKPSSKVQVEDHVQLRSAPPSTRRQLTNTPVRRIARTPKFRYET